MADKGKKRKDFPSSEESERKNPRLTKETREGFTSSSDESDEEAAIYRLPLRERMFISDDEVETGTFLGCKTRSKTNKDMLRIIYQKLRELDLNKTADVLAEESNLRMEYQVVKLLEVHVMRGAWKKVEKDIEHLKRVLQKPYFCAKMKFLVREQKYLELLYDDLPCEAIQCMKEEIKPLRINMQRVCELGNCVLCTTTEELLCTAKWSGKGPSSRAKLVENLKAFIPPRIVVPPKRLDTLFQQAIEWQKSNCLYHNIGTNGPENLSLLADHSCTKEQLPCKILQVLKMHSREVLFCRFSNHGVKLATASADATVMIWDVNMDTLELSHNRTFESQLYGFSSLSWSLDDNYIIACGPEYTSDLCVWNVESGILRAHINRSSDGSFTACSWHNSSKKFVVGGRNGSFFEYDLDGNLLNIKEGVRVHCLWYLKDGCTVLAADSHHRIKGYNFENSTEFNILQEENTITSFVCNQAERLAAVSVCNQGLHLWDIEAHILVLKFQGFCQGSNLMYSSFGGVNQVFLATGSEDGKIYIHNIRNQDPIAVLHDHNSDTVNAVTWNPQYPHMLASASDDTTVKVWVSADVYQKPGASNKVVEVLI